MTYLEKLEEELSELKRQLYRGERHFAFDFEMHLLQRLIREEKWKTTNKK